LLVIIIIVIFIIDFSNHNIDAHSDTAAIPLIVVTHEEIDTASSRLLHQSSRVDTTTKNPYSSITPINMDNISLKGIRRKKFIIKD
jgi:hypothetical protein